LDSGLLWAVDGQTGTWKLNMVKSKFDKGHEVKEELRTGLVLGFLEDCHFRVAYPVVYDRMGFEIESAALL